LSKHVELTGQVPRSEIAAHFAWADVFVLPSLIEGSATVVYEALSAGLPVICTPNTGSVVRDGHNGYIVPIRDADAMCTALSRLADDPMHLKTMAANARLSDADYSFDSYRLKLLQTLGDFARSVS
jgi:glycosyltransferase involved in cell wall biosynthesis